MGRATSFTQEVADAICERLAAGESLRAICAGENMPSEVTVRRWATSDVQGFAAHYARARQEGYDAIAEQIVEISDETEVATEYEGDAVTLKLDSTAVQRNKLRVDARKWLLSKLAPKKYGDRTVLAGDPDAPLAATVNLAAATPEQLRALASLKLPNEGEDHG